MEHHFFNMTPVNNAVTTRSALRVWWLTRCRGYRIYRFQRRYESHWLPWQRWITEYQLLPVRPRA